MSDRPFRAKVNYTIAVTTTSAGQAIDLTSESLRIHNKGPSDVFVKFGVDPVTATNADMHIAPGAIETFSKDGFQYMAAICETGTSTLRVSAGMGV